VASPVVAAAAVAAALDEFGGQVSNGMTTINSSQVFQKSLSSAIVPIGCERPVGETLPAAVERIVHELIPEKVVLFGSYAYGVPTPDSDVDLLIILKTDAPSKNRSWAVSQLLLPRPFPVDILVRTPQEIEQALVRGDFFVREILERGVVLYERRN
jgi:uncharacterized protein